MGARLVFAVGGTGGHVFPAQALARQILENNPQTKILFVGGGLDDNPFYQQNTYDYCDIDCGALVSRNPFSVLVGGAKIIRGVGQSWRILGEFDPQLVVGFGSFQVFPVLLAAKLRKVPLALHEGNSIPGKVNKFFAPLAKVTAVQFPDAMKYLKGPARLVDMPLRDREKGVSKRQAASYFNLDPDKKTILVFGGSQGAQNLNRKYLLAAANLAKRGLRWQTIHLTGNSQASLEARQTYERLGVQAYVSDFEDSMDLAWQAADLCLTRAGAATIAEMLHYQVPAILVPYPYATDNHQEANANFVVDKVGGALKILERDISGESLSSIIYSFINDDNHSLAKMANAISLYHKEHQLSSMSSLIGELIGADR
ncbi:MAG: undecaprenyldiphospho-muramoylpentapeptide beta-N-acetylglucosaminyltransferase [Chlamydiota bacterium]